VKRHQNARRRYENVSHALVNAGDTPIATWAFGDRCKFERFAFFCEICYTLDERWLKRHGVTAPED